jgi:putative ABC transport system permease protein
MRSAPILLLAQRSLYHRRGTVLLTLLSIAISVALLLSVERIRNEARASLANTISGTDLIVGARSGTINLLLYSVFRMGEPVSNMSWESYEEIANRDEVAWTVPISLGDSHRGFRVVGTTPGYFEHYRFAQTRELEFAAGRPFADVYDTVLGAEVAEQLGYGTGAEIVIAHGLGATSFAQHDDKPFTVSGVLRRTGTPVDNTVHVLLEGIEAIHVGWESGVRTGRGLSATVADSHARDLTPEAITAVLVGLNSRLSTFSLQREINEYPQEALTAIIPGVALQQLWSLLGLFEIALWAISAVVVAAGLVGMLIAILTTLNERRREMAILRSIGARPLHVFALLVCEAGMLAATGSVAGLALVYGALWFATPVLEDQFGIFIGVGYPTIYELAILCAVVCAALLMAMLPAWQAYRNTLADGMTIRV